MQTRNVRSTRDRLLTETIRLVRQQGFSRTSVNALLKVAGIKKGALYHHFPSKDDLGFAILARDRDEFLAFLNSALSAPTPLDGIDRFFSAVLQKHRETGFVGGCLWGNTALEMSDTNPAYTALVARVFQEWTAKIKTAIRAGQDCGQIRADIAATDLANLVVAGIEGGIMQSRLKKHEGPLRSCLASLRALLVEEPRCRIPSSRIEESK